MVSLDKFDKMLLQELDSDSSQPLHQLAKKARRSKQFVSFRLKRLQEEEIILGYIAIVDLLALGYFPFRVYIDFERMTELDKDKFVQAMKKHPQVVQITLIREKWDLALFLVVKDIQELRELWDTILFMYRSFIKKHEVSLYAPLHNFPKTFLAQPQRKERILGARKEITSVEESFVRHYAKNVRQTIVELSKTVHKNPKTVIKMVDSLEKEQIIVGYQVHINPLAFACKSYLVSFLLREGKHSQELFHYCKSIPEVYQINRIIGGDDLELLFMVENRQELLKLVDQIKEKFRQSIVDDSSFEFTTVYSQGIIPV